MRQLKVSDLSRYEIDGWDDKDYPDYCDAYISRAWDWLGIELTEEEVTYINENDYAGLSDAVEKELPNHLAGSE